MSAYVNFTRFPNTLPEAPLTFSEYRLLTWYFCQSPTWLRDNPPTMEDIAARLHTSRVTVSKVRKALAVGLIPNSNETWISLDGNSTIVNTAAIWRWHYEKINDKARAQNFQGSDNELSKIDTFLNEYERLLKHPIPHRGRAAKGVKEMLRQYPHLTLETFTALYKTLKADFFWDKPLSTQSMLNQLGQFLINQAEGIVLDEGYEDDGDDYEF